MTKKRKPLFSRRPEESSDKDHDLSKKQTNANECNKSEKDVNGPINKIKEKVRIILDTDSTYPFF